VWRRLGSHTYVHVKVMGSDQANYIHVPKYPALLNLQHHFLFSNGIFNATTAYLVLKHLMYDGYKDDGTVLSGYKFKVI